MLGVFPFDIKFDIMKALLGKIGLMLLFSTLIMSFNQSSKEKVGLSPNGKKKIDVTITSTGGCSVHIVGTVTYSLLPPSIDGFSGTVTITGPSSCPNGTMNFDKASTKLNMSFDSQDVKKVTKITWSGTETSYSSVLNDSKVNSELVKTFNSLD